MGILTETFVANSSQSYSSGGWVNPENAWDGTAETFAVYAVSNGNFYDNYLDIAWTDMTSISDVIHSVELGVRAESDVGEGYLVFYPTVRSRYQKTENGVVFTPTTEPLTLWEDITQFIDTGKIQTTWTRDEVEKIRWVGYPMNPNVFTEVDIRLYEVYLRITYQKVGTIPVSTSGRFYPYMTKSKDVVNGTVSVSTRGQFELNGTSTPDGDDWYGYKNDGFFDESIDPVWNEHYTDGTAVEGKYSIELTSGEGALGADATSMNGIYQITHLDKNLDIRLKISNIDPIEYPTPPPWDCGGLVDAAEEAEDACFWANFDTTGYEECMDTTGDEDYCFLINFDTTGYDQCLLDSTAYQAYAQCAEDYYDSTAYAEYQIELAKYRNIGVGFLVKTDDQNYISGYALQNTLAYKYQYYINPGGIVHAGGGALARSQFIDLPYFFRITCEKTMKYYSEGGGIWAPVNSVVIYSKTEQEDEWEEFLSADIDEGDQKEIWIFAQNNEAPQFNATIDWFGGTDRYINDRHGTTTLGIVGMKGDVEGDVT